MASIRCAFHLNCSIENSPPTPRKRILPNRLTSFLSSTFKPFPKDLRPILAANQVAELIKMASRGILDSVAENMFKFVDHSVSDSAFFRFVQGNYAPVDEIGEAVVVAVTEGRIPEDFPEGVYIRNGSNPLFPDKIVASSALGEVYFDWFQGDGMVHATYFNKEKGGGWTVSYKNRYIEAKEFLMEREKNKILFLPSVGGQPLAVISTIILNMLRYGKAYKDYNNTNVFEHAGKVYAITENHLPYEFDTSNLETKGAWNVNGDWKRAFTSHPKRAPGSGELVMMGVDAVKPHYVLGVISADGKKMVHKADLKFKTSALIHELGVTENYNIIMDYPLGIGLERLLADKTFIGYDQSGQSKIGVMPRYGDAESITWFDVEQHCSFHYINTFEDGDKVVIRGCRTSGSIVPGPDHKVDDKSKWYRRAYMKPPSKDLEGFDPSIDGVLFSRPYEWRLNLKTRGVEEGFITSPEIAMDFPTINNTYLGKRSKYGYCQVVDSVRSAEIGVVTYSMFAKLSFDKKETENDENIKVEYHSLGENKFCSGLQFVEKPGATEEDEGWLVCYVHDENTNISHVHIVDARKFTQGPVATITLPQRIPYGFHGAYVCK